MLINVGVYHVMILSITHLDLSPEAPQLFGAAPAASHGRCIFDAEGTREESVGWVMFTNGIYLIDIYIYGIW